MDDTPRQHKPHGQQQARLRRDNWRMFGKLSVIVAAMGAFGYALVPMYETICDALGINVLSVSERVTTAG
ncbi:MAG TPA: hypothetical protein VLF15_12120, partial [Pseudoxanthomonas sp.]|nr:hypothetical protein [Pseudoxanthomonas sp.]